MARVGDWSAPIWRWHEVGEPYERLEDCEAALTRNANDERQSNKGKKFPEQRTFAISAGCVASDDPRLKRN
jgi:hypothetical protein